MNSRGQFGFGILGCGVIANWHVQAIQASDGGYFAGAADVRHEYAEALCTKHGVYFCLYLSKSNKETSARAGWSWQRVCLGVLFAIKATFGFTGEKNNF